MIAFTLFACGSIWPGAEPNTRVTPDPRLGMIVSEDKPFRVLEVWGSSAAEGAFVLVHLGPGWDGEVFDAPAEFRAYAVDRNAVRDIPVPFDADATVQTAWALGATGAVVTIGESGAEVHVYDGSWRSIPLPDEVFQPGDGVYADPSGLVLVRAAGEPWATSVWAHNEALGWQALSGAQDQVYSHTFGAWSPEGFVLVSVGSEGLCAEDIDAETFEPSGLRCGASNAQNLVGTAFNGSSSAGFMVLQNEPSGAGVTRIHQVLPDSVVRGDSVRADYLWPTPGSEGAVVAIEDRFSVNAFPTLHTLADGAIEGYYALPPISLTATCDCDRDQDRSCDCVPQALPSVITTVTDDAVLWVSIDAVDGRRNVRAKWLDLPLSEHPIFDDCPEECPTSCGVGNALLTPVQYTCIPLDDALGEEYPILVEVGISLLSEPVGAPEVILHTVGEPSRAIDRPFMVSADATHTLEVTGAVYDTYTIGPFTTGGLGSTVLLEDYRFTRGLRLGEAQVTPDYRSVTAIHPATHSMVVSAFGLKLVRDDGSGPQLLELGFGTQTLAGELVRPQFTPSGGVVISGGWTGQGWDAATGVQLFSVNGNVLPRLSMFSRDEGRVLLQGAEDVRGPYVGQTFVVEPLTGGVVWQSAGVGHGSAMSGDGGWVSRIEAGAVVLYDLGAGSSVVLDGFPLLGDRARTFVTDEGRVVVHDLVGLGPWNPIRHCGELDVPCDVWVGSVGVPAVPLGDGGANLVAVSGVDETAITVLAGVVVHHDLDLGVSSVVATGGSQLGRAGDLVMSAGQVPNTAPGTPIAVVDLADGSVVFSADDGFAFVQQLQDGTVLSSGPLLSADGTIVDVRPGYLGWDGLVTPAHDGNFWHLGYDDPILGFSREALTDASVSVELLNVMVVNSLNFEAVGPYGAPCIVYRRADSADTVFSVDGGWYCAWRRLP